MNLVALAVIKGISINLSLNTEFILIPLILAQELQLSSNEHY